MKTESQGEYIFIINKNHPMADSRGRILEHRYVVSQSIGRVLDKNEVVHHKNGNKKDNRIENLELMLHNDHSKMHNASPQHGTYYRYRKGCRCDLCTKANRDKSRLYEQRKRLVRV